MTACCRGSGCESELVGDGEALDRQHGYEIISYAGKRLYRGASTSWAWYSLSDIPWADKLVKDYDEAR